jgi:flagellar basal body-associated protein FliL
LERSSSSGVEEMEEKRKERKILAIPLLIAVLLSILAVYFLYIYLSDKSQTTALAGFGALLIAIRGELKESGVYQSWRI